MNVRATLLLMGLFGVACGPPPSTLASLRGRVSATLDYTPSSSTGQVTGVDLKVAGTDACVTISAQGKVNGQPLPLVVGGYPTSSAHGLVSGCTPAALNTGLGALPTPLTGDLDVTLSDASDTLELTQPHGFDLLITRPDTNAVHVGDVVGLVLPALYTSNVITTQWDTAALPTMELARGTDGVFRGTVPASVPPGSHELLFNEPVTYTPDGCVGFARCTVNTELVQRVTVLVQ